MPTADAPRFFTDIFLLVKLPDNYIALAKNGVLDPKDSSIHMPL